MLKFALKKVNILLSGNGGRQYKGITFRQAISDFIKADKALQAYLNKIKRLAKLHASKEVNNVLKEIAQKKGQIYTDIAHHRKNKPHIFERLFSTKIAKAYYKQLNLFKIDLEELLTQERYLKAEVCEVHPAEYAELLSALRNINLPPEDERFEDSTTQFSAFWQNETLNMLRTNLFIAALSLHEAWLAEVLKSGEFRDSLWAITNLLTNKPLVNPSDEILIWQNLFMIIPVISSTFASIARQFKNVGAHIEISEFQQWVGCPLRVHRRCLDPMFSVSNTIAYNHKMLNARSEGLTGDSCWFDIGGEAVDKQYVSEQGEFSLKLLVNLYDTKTNKLPNLYIITPFKHIRFNLHYLINNTTCLSASKSDLEDWCTRHIGTVHTFQGKEAETVIFVLGADKKNQGAINWASSKPNLLNVALTRARNNIYVIGDYQLWSDKPYFVELSNALFPALKP